PDPEGRRVKIAYAVLESTSQQPAPDPLVYLEGGPGGSALTAIESRAEFFAEMRAQRDIVLFDQRGARLSTPLRCQAFSLANLLTRGTADATPPATPEAQTAARFPDELGDPYEIMQAARKEVAPEASTCAREIVASGVDLR